eukprot:gene1575-958_t
MNFGYDASGNRVVAENESSSEEEEEEVQSSSTLDDVKERCGGSDSEADSSDDGDESSSNTSSSSSEAEIIVGEEPTHRIDQPLVNAEAILVGGARQRDQRHTFFIEHKSGGTGDQAPSTTLLLTDRKTPVEATSAFMDMLAASKNSPRVRNAALIGALHHGKTSLLQMWMEGSAESSGASADSGGYRQSVDEMERGVSIKCHVVTLIARGAALEQASHLLTLIDTPGHNDFVCEAAAGLRLADAAVLCVDVVESLLASTEAQLQRAVQQERLPVVLVLTKLDRLIVELKLPPADAYRKLRLVIDTVNNAILRFGGSDGAKMLVSPENGTVLFSSAALGFCFTLETFSVKYAAAYPGVHPAALSKHLWGQITFDGGAFKPLTNVRQRNTFVQFILEPLYKMALTQLPRSPFQAAREAVAHFFGSPAEEGLDALLSVLPPPLQRSRWLETAYQLGAGGGEVEDVEEASAAPLAVAPLVRLYAEGGAVAAVVRVVRGTLERAAALAAVDDACSEAEPCYPVKVDRMFVLTPQGPIPVLHAREGQVVFITGIGQRQGKHLALVGGAPAAAALSMLDDSEESDWLDLVRLAPCTTAPPLIHVDLELRDPRSLDSFQMALQTLQRTTPGIDAHRQETGEFTLRGYGELHLDTALRELRQVLCPNAHVSVSEPYVRFAETVLEDEGLLATAGHKWCTIGCVCGVLSREFTSAMESETIEVPACTREVADTRRQSLTNVLREEFGFDALDSANLMGLGPDTHKGPNAFFDDTLPEECALAKVGPLSSAHREAILTGFRSAVATGPLVGEVVRGVGVKLIFANIDPGITNGVVVANARTAARQALLGARPRLLEPILSCEVLCAAEEDKIEKVRDIFTQRRGVALQQHPIPATNLTRLMALVPAIDSFGLETQIRMATHGQCFPAFSFSNWDVVPGDPYDAKVRLGPLEPAQGYQLSRDFVLKTRFRKGMSAQLLVDV